MALAKVALRGAATLNGSPTAVSITATPSPAASKRPAYSLLAPDVQNLSVPSTGKLDGLTLDIGGPAGTWPTEGSWYHIEATAGGVTREFSIWVSSAVKSIDLTGELTFTSAPTQSHPVTSVAGKTGAVTLVKGDVGLGNVDNTSDASKPISTAVQTALNGKADSSHDHDDAYAAVDHGHDIADVSGLQSALDGKAASGHSHTGLMTNSATAIEDLTEAPTMEDFNTLLAALRSRGVIA